ncbi:MAG: flagellar basal body-associated FliL family protein [Anaerolineales bacterium]|jgi:flagellar FliL protein|nr:flagellar basal body-associated FliL family protein [Anaerolineales bacterium]
MEKVKPFLKWGAVGVLALLLFVTLIFTLIIGYFMLTGQIVMASSGGSSQAGAAKTARPSANTGDILPFLNPPSVPFEIKPGQGIMFDTGTKIVNLAEPSGRRYIRANIVLEFAPDDIAYYLTPVEPASESSGGEGKTGAAQPTYAEKFKTELEDKRPLIDDTIITLLSSKSFESIYTAAGKEQLRNEIMTLLNARMPEYRIILVYFTEFTVQ